MGRYRLAYALGGGGSRGALQVGAIRALLAAGVVPDLLVGTSAGAINATYLAIRGLTPETLDDLERCWHEAGAAELIPPNLFRLTARVLLRSTLPRRQEDRRRKFFIDQGLNPALRFRDLTGIRLFQVVANVTTRRLVIYGSEPEQSVLCGLLASTAIVPWADPLHLDEGTLVDGGLLSNLPIEPTLSAGADAIIAFDISNPLGGDRANAMPMHGQVLATLEQRHIELEMALAAARGVPVLHVLLSAPSAVPFWDFSRTGELIAAGYAQVERLLAEQPEAIRNLATRPRWLRKVRTLLRR